MFCTVCHSRKESLKYFDLYTVGSEGTNLCMDCETAVIGHIRDMIKLATKSRTFGYRNAKEIAEAKANQEKKERENEG